jgi:hypothetical protein
MLCAGAGPAARHTPTPPTHALHFPALTREDHIGVVPAVHTLFIYSCNYCFLNIYACGVVIVVIVACFQHRSASAVSNHQHVYFCAAAVTLVPPILAANLLHACSLHSSPQQRARFLHWVRRRRRSSPSRRNSGLKAPYTCE